MPPTTVLLLASFFVEMDLQDHFGCDVGDGKYPLAFQEIFRLPIINIDCEYGQCSPQLSSCRQDS